MARSQPRNRRVINRTDSSGVFRTDLYLKPIVDRTLVNIREDVVIKRFKLLSSLEQCV
jgi:hypothetical protein